MQNESSPASSRRPVRSFVRRAGRVTRSQARALAELWPVYGLDIAEGTLDCESVFGRSSPVVLEIGFGNGDVLAAMAAADPDCDYLGIEVHRPGIGHCMIEADKLGVGNLRIIEDDAVEILAGSITRGSLARVNLFFPDPWPKKRHHKRRIVQGKFVGLVVQALEPGGTFHVATDWQPYAEHIADVIARESRLTECATPTDRPGSKFERRGVDLGHRIWEKAWSRSSGQSA